ncbi:MAG: endolytic transglycosylase MltG, partial [Burkholderiales bacterium]
VVSRTRALFGEASPIRAGQYLFAPPKTIAEIFDALESGAAIQLPFTVVEGTTQRALFEQLKKATQEQRMFRSDSVTPPEAWSRALQADVANLEGFLFPDTYLVAPESSANLLLSAMHRRMKQELATAWEQRAPDTPLRTPYEALILASIIEKETGKEADRPLVGSVFINRLRIGMRLQTDPTVIYGLGEKFDGNLRKIDLQTDTPYNSYTRDGLPPTPIAFPGKASLRAAVNPPKSDFLYFVARGDGSSEFSRNLAEHNRAVAKYQLGR